tara:strand:- start:3080 stop:3499 length:420 start_codon:yes stop_codon:yes gene_type:complete
VAAARDGFGCAGQSRRYEFGQAPAAGFAGNSLGVGSFNVWPEIGGFDPKKYKQDVSGNANFRKFDDGLKMTIDCDAATVADLRALLDTAAQAGTIRYGLHEQDEAMMTCIVPSAMQNDHVHFIDGAAGGYTQAAAAIKA